MRTIMGFVAVMTFWGQAVAAPEAEWVCDRATNNADHIQCADAEFRKYDAELNAVYQALVKQLSTENEPLSGYGPSPLQALREAQRAWLGFRDANCHWESTAFYGGTGQGVIRVSCRAVMTRDRVAVLRTFLQN